MGKITDGLLSAINSIVSDRLKNASFDYTVRGKVKSVGSNSCVVTIYGQDYTCSMLGGISFTTNDVVLVQIIQNNFSDKVVVGKILI